MTNPLYSTTKTAPLGRLTGAQTSKTSPGTFAYDGISGADSAGRNSGKKITFNYNDALAQMLFIKLIEMQMSSIGGRRTGSV